MCCHAVPVRLPHRLLLRWTRGSLGEVDHELARLKLPIDPAPFLGSVRLLPGRRAPAMMGLTAPNPRFVKMPGPGSFHCSLFVPRRDKQCVGGAMRGRSETSKYNPRKCSLRLRRAEISLAIKGNAVPSALVVRGCWGPTGQTLD
ncbi:unnamed protein product [Boreogadus saida]